MKLLNRCLLLILIVFLKKINAQSIILITENQDQFIGDIICEDGDTMVFKLSTEDELWLNQKDIQTVQSVTFGSSVDNDMGCGLFDVNINGESSLYCEHVKLNKNRGRLHDRNSNRRSSFKIDDIEWIEFLEEDCEETRPNNYLLKSRNGINYIGKLNLINKNGINISTSEKFQKTFFFSEVNKLKYIREKLPAFGHERSLFLTATGFNLKKGERILQSAYVFHNTVAFGVTDNFSVHTGLFVYLPIIGFKLSQDVGKYVHFSVGGGVAIPELFDLRTSLSLGTPDYYLNVGYHFIEDFNSDIEAKIKAWHMGGSIRVARRLRLFAEYIPYYELEDYEWPSRIGALKGNYNRIMNFGVAIFSHRTSFEFAFAHIAIEERFISENGPLAYTQFSHRTIPLVGIGVKHKLKNKKKK